MATPHPADAPHINPFTHDTLPQELPPLVYDGIEQATRDLLFPYVPTYLDEIDAAHQKAMSDRARAPRYEAGQDIQDYIAASAMWRSAHPDPEPAVHRAWDTALRITHTNNMRTYFTMSPERQAEHDPEGVIARLAQTRPGLMVACAFAAQRVSESSQAEVAALQPDGTTTWTTEDRLKQVLNRWTSDRYLTEVHDLLVGMRVDKEYLRHL